MKAWRRIRSHDMMAIYLYLVLLAPCSHNHNLHNGLWIPFSITTRFVHDPSKLSAQRRSLYTVCIYM